MIKITETESKVTPSKVNIKLDNIFVDKLRFVDETGDITADVIGAIPDGVDTVSFRISVEVPSENE